MDELLITTRAPDGGGVFRVRVPVRGLPEPEYADDGQIPVVEVTLIHVCMCCSLSCILQWRRASTVYDTST